MGVAGEKDELDIQVNGQTIQKIDFGAVESYTEMCDQFGSGKMDVLRVVSEAVHIPDNSVVVAVAKAGTSTFAISDVTIYSIKKS